MSTDNAYGERPGLFGRVRNLIVAPQREWTRIGGESGERVVRGHVAPLAILSALSGLVGGAIESGFAINSSLIWSGVSASIFVALTVLAVVALGWAIDWLAPRFGAARNPDQARKLAGYSITPFLLAGIAALAPLVAPIFLIAGAIYSAVLLVIGLSVLMPPGENRLTAYAISLFGSGVAAMVVYSLFAAPLLRGARELVADATSSLAAATTTAPPVPQSEAQRALQRVAQAYGPARPVDAARLIEQLPRTLPSGFELAATTSGGAPGITTVTAEYRADRSQLTILVVHYSGAEGAAGLASVVNAPPPGRTADGYARVEALDNRLYIEEFGAGSAPRYGIVGAGIALLATGSAEVTIDQARAAVETLSIQRLERLFGE